MNDWISRSQANSRREIKKKTAIDGRFQRKVARELAERQSSYEINQVRIEEIYRQSKCMPNERLMPTFRLAYDTRISRILSPQTRPKY
jgi:hypothetical protein